MTDQRKDLRKLCILNAKEADDDEKVRSLCESFGHLVHFNRPPSNKRLAFPLYMNESDAQRAKEGLIAEGYRVNFANAKRTDNSSEDTGYQKRSSFRTQQNTADGSENGCEADSSTDNRPYGECIKCGDKAYFNCGRCREFYCSEECQESDWLKHKPLCIAMPKLVPAKSTFSIRASRSNLSVSNEKPFETNHMVADTDAADGQQNLFPQKAESVASASNKVPMSSAASDNISNSGKRSHTTEKVTQSPRARLLAQTNAESPKSAAQPINGLITATIPNNSEVFITHVRSHRTVYIRSALTNDDYMKLITEVEEASKTQPRLTVFPGKNDVVMAPFDGIYYRGMVISGDKASGIVKIGFIDFGNSEEVPFSHLKSLPENLQKYGRLVVQVALKDIHDDYESNEKENMCKHLNELCNEAVGLKVKSDNAEITAKDSVELFDLITNQSISEVFDGMIQKRYCIEDLKHKVISDASDQNLMIIGSERILENYVTCILKADVGQFMDSDHKIQDYGASVKNAPAYKPKPKELCVVEIKEPDGKIWYRCQYQQELVDDRAQVYCFDYGKIMHVRENNIRAMTADLAFEVTSFMGYLDNGHELSKEAKEAIVENPAAFAKSIKYHGDLHHLTLVA